MALSNSRKASIGVLTLALAALAVDRFVLGGGSPQAAQAAGVPGTTAAGLPVAGTATRAEGNTLSIRFDALARVETLDPLAVPDVFDVQAWRLSALVGTGAKGGVIINNALVAVGQDYQGARLLSVSKDGAEFARNGHRFVVPFQPGAAH